MTGPAGPADSGADWSASLRRGPASELRGWLDVALALSDEADLMALAGFQRDMEITTKPDRSLVTQVDQAIETRLRERIAAAYPGHGVLGEEQGLTQPDAAVRWYVDPIDGTHNFIRGVPLFGSLLGIARDGEMQVGVISAPALRHRWFAWRGGGAWVVGSARATAAGPRRIHVSAVARMADAQLVYSSPTDIEPEAPGFRTLVAQAWRDRGFGDFWGYSLVAEGAAEAMIEVGMHAWDLAGPLVVLEEAGARVTDFTGRRTIDASTFVASNGLLHEAILAGLRA
ncbi:MAG TPA: inositol monophosphatase family protein [Candidatus Sulfotelmatobacter sp.]|nr:inositol monophosphatase family protein [Candidatus Sulfotelmatobacter sp.]